MINRRGSSFIFSRIISVSTASRLLSRIDEEMFLYAFMEWTGEIQTSKGIHLTIDGNHIDVMNLPFKPF
ncbi:MAG: hypothetical protein IKF90_04215 [Parasporobacterium sp.]|nr:hypothetical protein [Parasporobacterium sp.]